MGVIDRLVYEVGYDVDKSSFDNVSKGVSDISGKFKQMAKFAGIAGAALAGFTILTTTQEAEIQRLSSAMGVGMDTVDAFGNEMKKIGGSTENFLDLIEETSNKIGEMKGLGELGTLEESLQILNLSFEDLQKLAPEEQFKAITESALAMEDSQKAVTAVDMLMGGEANKLIASLRAQGLTYDDVIRKQKLLTFQTEESRKNSLQFANGLNDLMRVISSLAKFVAGELGGVMSEMVTQFTEWAVANKEVIASGIMSFVKGLAAVISGLWTVFSALGRVVVTVVDALGGLGSVIRIIIAGGVLFGFIKIAQAITFIGIAAKRSAFSMAFLNKAFRTLRNLLLIGVLVAIFEDLIGWINGTDSVMGRLVGTFDEWWDQFKEGSQVIANFFTTLGTEMLLAVAAPFNFMIDALNRILQAYNSLGSVLGFKGIDELKNFTIGGSTGVVNEGLRSVAGGIGNAVSSNVSNAIEITVNATGDAVDIAKEVGREVERAFESANTSMQTVNK